MASDWRILPEPLARFACLACGLARRWPASTSSEALFSSGYALYAHVPGDARERTRQARYAAWIAEAVADPPRCVLDVGCGNGSLLLAMGERWPEAELEGCDPSAESVAHGASSGVRLWQGTSADLPRGTAADLVVSINVIEHTADPAGFLRNLRSAMTPDGVLAIVCPDGGRPGLELLFADHVFSFAPHHLEALLGREGLRVAAMSTAPPALGDFQMVVARQEAVAASSDATTPQTTWPPPDTGRSEYLQRWRALDRQLEERVVAPAVCFGAGEAAGLLRAYAPRTWRRLRACTVDGDVAAGATFGDLPLVPVASVSPDDTVLVGVRPSDQAGVAERLRARGARVVTWYDLVDPR